MYLCVHSLYHHSQVSSDGPLCCSTPKKNQFIQGQEQLQEAGQESVQDAGQEQEQLQEPGQQQLQEPGQDQLQEPRQEQLQEPRQEQLQEPGQEQEKIRESFSAQEVLDQVVKNAPLFKDITALCQVLCPECAICLCILSH